MKKYFPLVLLLCFSPLVSAQVDFRWISDADGDWSDAANWENLTNPPDGGIPNGATHRAIFSDEITANRVVNVDGTFSLKDIVFQDTTHSYTLSGSGQIIGPPEATFNHLEIFVKNASSHTISATLGAPHFRNILIDLENVDSQLTLDGELVRSAGSAAGFGLQARAFPGTLIYAATATNLNSVSNITNGAVGIAVDNSLGTTFGGGQVGVSLTGSASVFAQGTSRTIGGGFSTNNGGTFNGSNGLNLTFNGTSTLGGSGDNPWVHTSTFTGPGVMTLNGTVTFAHTVLLQTPNTITPGKVVFTGNNNATMANSDPRQIRFRHALTVGIGSDLAFGAGTLLLSGTGPIFMAEGASHNIANNLNLQSFTLGIAGSDQLTMSGVISGSGGLTKNDAGTFVLGGNSTYTGTTTVNAGTLLVTGTHTGAGTYAVSNTGTVLGGSGRINTVAGITVGSGAIVAPGTSIGALVIDGENSPGFPLLTMNTGAVFEFELNGSGGTADRIDFWNYILFGEQFELNNNSINLTLLGTITPGNYTVDLFRFYEDDGTTLVNSDLTSGLVIGSLGAGIQSASLNFTGETIELQYEVIPEPGISLLFLLGAAGLLVARRRSKS